MGTAEEAFDRAKALTERPALFDADLLPSEMVGPWVRPCGAPGPYAIRRPTPKQPTRLEIASCTRPENHGGAFHQHADARYGVICQWTRDGRADWPPLVKGGSTSGPTDSV